MVVEHSRSMIQALKFICSVIVAMMAEEEGKKNPVANTTEQNEPEKDSRTETAHSPTPDLNLKFK